MSIIFHGCGETVGVIDSERLVESLEVERLETGYRKIQKSQGRVVILLSSSWTPGRLDILILNEQK